MVFSTNIRYCLTGLFVLIGSMWEVVGQTTPMDPLVLWGNQLRLDGQQPWMAYTGNDAPAGAYLARLDPGVASVNAAIDLGSELPPGTYYVYVKVLDYDLGHQVGISLGGEQQTVIANDRDLNLYWTTPVTLNLATTSRELKLKFIKTRPSETTTRCLLIGVCVTTTANAYLTRADSLISYRYPEAAEYDNSTPIKGNLITDGSFETGWGHGWGLSRIGRAESIRDMWTTGTGYHGSGSLRLPASSSPGMTIVSRPYCLKPNKKYTLSAYVKSPTGRNWASLLIKNATVPPTGLGFKDQQVINTAVLADSTWKRLSLSGVMLKYPDCNFQVSFTAQGYDGGSVIVDAIQLEEGDISPFVPHEALELGLSCGNAGNLFFEDETPQVLVRVCSDSTSIVATSAQYEVFNVFNQLVQSGSVALTVPARGVSTTPIILNYGKRGIFRIRAWISGMTDSEDELVCSVLPRPAATGADPDSTIGNHVDYYPWQLALMQKMGVKWTRGLSTGQYWRWLNAEPTEGHFVWFDEFVDRPAAYGINIMANIGENAPPWAYRTYFGISNISGTGFVKGEVVRSATGSGTVTVVLDQSSATGHALQLNAVTGNFTQGATITGSTSGTSATVATSVYPQSVALDKWETYVATVVGHYGNKVAAWEIWNEPDQDGDEIPQPNGNNGFYCEILRRAALKIRAVAQTAKIVGMGGVSSPAYIRQAMNHLGAAATNYVDAMAVHLYHPNGVMGASLKTETIDVYNKPLWNTETGVWDLGMYSGVNANFLLDGKALRPFRDAQRFYDGHTKAAASLAVNFLQTTGYGLNKYFYYDSRQATRPDIYKSHPTMLEYDDSLRPKGVAYAILGHVFDHARGLGKLALSSAAAEAFLYDRGGQALAAIYAIDSKDKEIDLPGLPAGSVRVLDIMGNPLEITGAKFRFGRNPVYVIATNVVPAQLRSAFESAPISEAPDTESPFLSITLGPRGNVTPDKSIRLRWLAMDRISLPDEDDPDALTYSWQLQGLDTTWSAWSGNTCRDYADLPQGGYTFRVKAKDKAGNVSPEQIREFVVGTPPPSRPHNLKVAR